MKFVTDCLYLIAIVLISPKIIYRILRHNRYRTGWTQRLGKISRRNPEKKCIWIHAVSVGEVNATKTLVTKLKDSLSNYEIVISSTTDTGLARAKAIYADRLSVFYFPFDLSFIMRRAFKNLQPDICLLMELEIWPNLTQIAAKANVPVIIVNGRLSDKSFPKYKLIKPLTRWMFAKVSLVLAQTQQYADRFIELGCPEQKVIVTSSLKYDTAEIVEKAAGTDQLSEQLNIGTDRLWVAGGTGPNEEKTILQTFEKLKKTGQLSDLRLAIVPRKPERFDEVAELIASCGFQSVRYSEIKANETKLTACPDIILGDTMGDLRKFYSLATIVFVGRTLTPMGGSDMMEPAALGKCTIFGPHTFNFRQTVQALLAGNGAIEVSDAEQLYNTTLKCLTDTAFAKKIARNGRDVIKQNQGATEKTVKAIIEISGEKNL